MKVRESAAVACILAAFLVASTSGALSVQAQEEEPPTSLFVVEFTTGPAWQSDKPFQDQPHAADHSANLRRLRDDGILVLGARHGTKGMVILRAPSEAAARSEIDRDPTVVAGVFAYSIEEFKPFYGGCIEQ